LTTPKDTCVSRFTKGFDVYMKSMIKEAEDWENKRVRTVDDYLQLRRETFAVQASVSFMTFGLELPEEVLLHPVIQTLTVASMDILFIINVSLKFDRTCKLTDVFIFQDMHSYLLELSRGIEFHNIITSIIHEHHLDVPAAMKWLEEFGRQRVTTFLNGIKELPSWGPEIDGKVRQYIDGIGYLVRGTDAWSHESERYWGGKGKEVQTTRMVTMWPGKIQEGLLTKHELKAAIASYWPALSIRM